MSSSLTQHPRGGYLFLPGIDPYSSGVVAAEGFEICHVLLESPVAWETGLHAVHDWLRAQDLSVQALCGVQLRCSEPHSFGSFSEFNSRYRSLLDEWEIPVDGVNPVARTNVAPVLSPPAETTLFAFSFCRRSDVQATTFVVAGGGELPHRDLRAEHIVRRGETLPDAMLEKASCVTGIMNHRLQKLDVATSPLSTVNVYTAHPVHSLLESVLLADLPAARRCGILWHYTRPPVQEIEFEMDVRYVRTELTLKLL